jgi:hypothetical protein
VKVGRPLEPKLAEASAQAYPHRLARVEPTVLLLPRCERFFDGAGHVVEPPGSLKGELLAEVPVGGSRIHPLPGKVDEDQAPVGSHETLNALDRGIEIVDVVERAARDDRVEDSRLVKLLQGRLPEDRPLRSLGVDRDHVVSRFGDVESELAGTAPDLEHAGRRGRKLSEHEGAVHSPYRGTGGPTRVSTLAA